MVIADTKAHAKAAAAKVKVAHYIRLFEHHSNPILLNVDAILPHRNPFNAMLGSIPQQGSYLDD